MRYAEAIAKQRSRVTADRIIPVQLVSSYSTETVATYLGAFGADGGIDYRITASTYGTLRQSLTLAATATDDALLLLLSLDDIFPQLGLRSHAEWKGAAFERLFADADATIAEFCSWLRGRLAARTGQAVIVPPLLDPPPLMQGSPFGMSRGRQLQRKVDLALAEAAMVPGARIACPAELFDGLADRDIRSDQMLFQAGCPFTTVGAERIAAFCHHALAAQREQRKLLVTDLDETLWKGVIGDDGPEGISARAEASTFAHHIYGKCLKLFASEGVILAIASRNDLEVVRAFLTNGAQRAAAGVVACITDFAHIACGWSRKSDQIIEICQTLNIAPSAVVFVDDNEQNLAEVRSRLPEVLGIAFPKPAGFSRMLSELRNAFSGEHATEDDRRRTEHYAIRRKALDAAADHDSIDAYLDGLDLRATFRHAQADDLRRARQLLNKTNQFNLTGERFDDHAWAAILADPTLEVLIGQHRDRFGDHGLVLAAIVRRTPEALQVCNLAMSCRVFDRGLEWAFVEWIVARYGSRVAQWRASWVRTGRNSACEPFCPAAGLAVVDIVGARREFAADTLVVPSHHVILEERGHDS